MTPTSRNGISHFTRGINHKPRATKTFESIVTHTTGLDGEVVYGYPFHRDHHGLHVVDVVLVSETGHVAIIDLVEGNDLTEYQNRQDRSFNLVDLRLRQNPAFRDRRQLIVPIQTLSYGPDLTDPDDDPEYPIATDDTLAQVLLTCRNSVATHPERTREQIILQIFTAF